jgi:dolichol kinase
VRRKALHLGALALPAGILLVDRPVAVPVLAALSALAVACDVARQRWAPARRLLHGLFAPIMRPEELPPFGGPVVINGATWVCVSSAVCAAAFAAPVAAAALVMQMIGDAAAAVVGRRLGRRRYPWSSKSLEGSAAFVATAFLAALPLAALPPALGAAPPVGALAAGALAAAVMEALPIAVNDNLRVPLAAGAAIALLG